MKYLILLIFLAVAYWYFIKRKRKLSSEKYKELAEEFVFDESCQTYIRKDEAIKVEVEGKTHYFCSKKCLEEFLQKNPKLQS
jgi:YHS domain-containing protein